MKIKEYLLGSITIFAGIIFFLILLINIFLVQGSFLTYTNEKYQVDVSLSLSKEDLKKATYAMVDYVTGKIDSPQVTVSVKGKETDFFNEKEIGHLADVRAVIVLIYVIMAICGIVSLLGAVYLWKRNKLVALRKGVYIAWSIILVLALVIAFIAVIDINILIVGFHKLFFTNDNWMLNFATDRSVWMFKEVMYADALIRIGAITGGIAVVTLGGAIISKKLKAD